MGMNELVRRVLLEVGIKPERFNLQWASAAEAPRFVKLITDFTGTVKSLGRIGEAEGLSDDEVRDRLTRALNLVSDKKLRVGYGNMTKALRKEGTSLTSEIIAQAVDEKLSKSITTLTK